MRLARVAWTELVTRPVVAAVAQPTVSGLDRLENLAGPVIFAPNHFSHLDAPLVLSALPEPWRHKVVTLAAADYFFDSRLKAAYFSFSLNAVPIERVRVSRDSAERAEALIADGWNLLIFPEGGRSPDGWGQPHRAGAAWLAARSGRPIVPIYVQGTSKLLPRGAKRLYTGKTSVTFGPLWPPMSPPVSSWARWKRPLPAWPTRRPPTGGRPAAERPKVARRHLRGRRPPPGGEHGR